MTSTEYFTLVSTYDQRRIETAIDRIPQNINRAGKHYQRLVKKIYENTIAEEAHNKLSAPTRR